MTPRWRTSGALALVAIAVTLATILLTRSQATAPHPRQGAVHFLEGSSAALDRFTAHRDPTYGAFLRRHASRMVVYSPYFDDKTRWYPRAWMYEDAYAIYRHSPLAAQHPDWILHDAAGGPLFIPFACGGGTCPQYAADIANPAFRRWWIDRARRRLAHGYLGLFIDDVNMEFRVGDGHGKRVAPIDRATNLPMAYDAWRRYMAQFMAQIRAAFPHKEIAHNVNWLAAAPAATADPYIGREIGAADYINLERGVNDPGLTGGSGPFSLTRFLAYIGAVHALGKAVVLDSNSTGRAEDEYSLASYFLISSGNDLVSAHGMTPANWRSTFVVNLGDARGPQTVWNGVLRRDFTRGMSLLNEPGSASRAITLPSPMRDLTGHVISSLTLPPASGAVLLAR
jgi:hypothetical protein